MEIIDTRTLSNDIAAELDRIHADTKTSRVAAIVSAVKCASCKAQGMPLVNFAQEAARAVDFSLCEKCLAAGLDLIRAQ